MQSFQGYHTAKSLEILGPCIPNPHALTIRHPLFSRNMFKLLRRHYIASKDCSTLIWHYSLSFQCLDTRLAGYLLLRTIFGGFEPAKDHVPP